MDATNSSHGGLTRRSFLKTTGAVAGATALAGVAAATPSLQALADDASHAAEQSEREFTSHCRNNCAGRCPIRVTVREGKVVNVTRQKMEPGDEDYERICIKGLAQPIRLYDPDRLKYPLRRVGERGEERWERISWDEALSTMAEKFQAVIDEYGGESIAMWMGWGGSGYLNGASPYGQANLGFGLFSRTLGTTVFDSTADMAYAYIKPYTGMSRKVKLTSTTADVEDARTIIIWGGDPGEAMQNEWIHIRRAVEKGAKLIVIDPRFSVAASHADLYLPIIPGTDGVLALAFCNYVIEHDLMDVTAMKRGSVGPLLLKEDGTYLRGSDIGRGTENDYMVWDAATEQFVSKDEAEDPALEGSFEVEGIKVETTFDFVRRDIAKYTMEYAAEYCGLDLDAITQAIEMYATVKPASIESHYGISHHWNSHHVYKGLTFLMALTGNWGRKGAIWMSDDFPISITINTKDCVPENAKTCICLPGMLFPQSIGTGKIGKYDINIKAIWFINGNPLAMESGRRELIEAVNTVDFIVTSDWVMTDTARMSDIVLPITHPFEELDFEAKPCHAPYVVMRPKIVEPQFECKNDLLVFRELAVKMGMDNLYDKTDEEYLRRAIDTEKNMAGGVTYEACLAGVTGGTPVRLTHSMNPRVTDEPCYETTTPTKRMEFYIEKPAVRIDYGQKLDLEVERKPIFLPPWEASRENPLYEKYPFFGCSYHPRMSAHSSCAHTKWMREVWPEPRAMINAKDAAEKGIENNDIIKVYNDRGYVVIKAMVTTGIREGVVCIPQGWQSDHFIEGHAQDLTDITMNDAALNSNVYDWLCQFEKVESGAK